MEKLHELADRWPWLRRSLDTQQRFGEINGGFVASAITVTIFTSIFPLLLVGIAVIGFLAHGDDQWATRFVDDLGLTGAARETVTNAVNRATESRQAASVVGLVGLLWSGTGVGLALQRGVRTPWQEPSLGMRDRLESLLWLVTAALGFGAVIALGSVLNWLPDRMPAAVAWVGAILIGLAAEVGLFLWMFWGLSTRKVAIRDLLPGAILAAVAFEALKLVGTVYVPQLVAKSSSLYGPLGIVFAILTWLALFARVIVYASTLNAVRYEAREGRCTVAIYVPNLPDSDIVAANRGGVMVTPAAMTPMLEIPTAVSDGADVDEISSDA